MQQSSLSGDTKALVLVLVLLLMGRRPCGMRVWDACLNQKREERDMSSDKKKSDEDEGGTEDGNGLW